MHRLTPFELHVAKQHRCSNLAVIQFQMREQLSQLDAISEKKSLTSVSRPAVRICLYVPACGF